MTVENTLQIGAYIHCALCLEERPDGTTPREWAQLEVGWTKRGFQVWCRRHEANVLHVDFEGQTHPANTTRTGTRKRYTMKYRPVSTVTLPEGVIWSMVEAPSGWHRPDLPLSSYRFGVFTTERPLTDEEMVGFEIEEVP